MKTTLLAGVLLMAALPAHAYVQPSSAISGAATLTQGVTDPSVTAARRAAETSPTVLGRGPIRRIQDDLPINRDCDDDKPTYPVPEPGTMAMASMGLLALGAAIRKRRAR